MVQFPSHYCAIHFEHEAEYLSNRQRWARSHEQQYSHKYNTVTRKRDDTKQQQYNFYRTRQWAHLRLETLERYHYLCQYCRLQGRVTPAKTVDHVVPIEYDDKLKAQPNNLAVTCGACHRIKTDWEQAYYGTGQEHELHEVAEVTEIENLPCFKTQYKPV